MWVYGKIEPGWYLAAAVWSEIIAGHWRSLGYQVERTNPDQKAA